MESDTIIRETGRKSSSELPGLNMFFELARMSPEAGYGFDAGVLKRYQDVYGDRLDHGIGLYAGACVVSELRARTAQVVSALGLESEADEEDKWRVEEIQEMVLKGLNCAALEEVEDSAKRAVAQLTGHVVGLELGCGAGWSTVLYIQELFRSNADGFLLHVIDKSPAAVASTTALLDEWNRQHDNKVCWEILGEDGEPVTTSSKREANAQHKLSFQCKGFIEATEELNNTGVKVNTVFSNHGLVYLEKEDIKKVLTNVSGLLTLEAKFIIDSLSTTYILELSKLWTMLGVITRGMFIDDNNSTPYPSKDKLECVSIYQMNTAVGRRFLSFLGQLLYHNYKAFKLYRAALGVSVASLERLISAVKVPASAISSDGLKVQMIPRPPYLQTVVLTKDQ